MAKLQHCSFCRKHHKQVRVLVSGENVAVCDGCLILCQDVVTKRILEENSLETPSDKLTPKLIYSLLSDYIIGQDIAKKVLAVAVHNHFKRIKSNSLNQDVEISKSNILLMGPTGSGKTLLAQSLGKILKLPVALGDATTLTEAGYVGEDVENLVGRLYQMTKGDIEKTKQGIIYVDEIDKIARRSESVSIGRDVSGEGVQQALLRLVEGAEVYVPVHGNRKTNQVEQVQVNTTNILFICGGAFVGLTDIINKRLSKNSGMGFARKTVKKNIVEEDYRLLQEVTEKDLQKFGIIPELIGRLPIVVPLQKLTEDQLVRILTEPKNALVKQYIRLFEENGIELTFSEDALYCIAHHAEEVDLGARALRRLMEGILLEPMFEAEDMQVKKLEITSSMVEGGLKSFNDKNTTDIINTKKPKLKIAAAK